MDEELTAIMAQAEYGEYLARNPELSTIIKNMVRYGYRRGIIQILFREEISETNIRGLCANIEGIDFYIDNNFKQSVEEYKQNHTEEEILEAITDAIAYEWDTELRRYFISALMLKFIDEIDTYDKGGYKEYTNKIENALAEKATVTQDATNTENAIIAQNATVTQDATVAVNATDNYEENLTAI